MKFYQTETKLIQYNPDTDVYKQMNSVERVDKIISKEDFLKLNAVQIKKQKYHELMNIYFRNVEHEWIYNNQHFKKLPNFESTDTSYSSNYVLGKQVPYHEISKYQTKLILVYHQGKVYYHTVSYNGYNQGQLNDIKTGKHVGWCQLKHCSPILNIDTNKIC